MSKSSYDSDISTYLSSNVTNIIFPGEMIIK